MKPEFIFYLLVFPGLIFTGLLGLSAGWLDRKISARFQFRAGPPFFQNFNDFIKLLGKDTLIVKDSISILFILSPLVSFSMLVLVSAISGMALFFNQSFGGDLIVIMYLLLINSITIVFGGASTGNVYSSVGAGREMKLLLADELAFIFVCLVPVVKSGYNLELVKFLEVQNAGGAFINSFSGIIGFTIGLLCIQAKMSLPPFNIPEAETEIVDGPFMEYSGPLLAFWTLNHFLMYVVFPFLLIIMFLGGFSLNGIGILWAVIKYLLILLVMIILKNTNPRVRIDTALNFFWKYAAAAGSLAVILAAFGW
ncbi:MAG: complex I subunit 1 family protein [Ignavibacteriales bacterium]